MDATLDAYPGQFIMVWLPRFDEKPFSLVNADPVTIMVTAVGPFSRLIHEQGPGDRIWVRGPYGHGFQADDAYQHIALVGGGYGVAPLYWLARSYARRATRITTMIGARTEADVLYADHFAALETSAGLTEPGGPLQRHASYTLQITTEDGSMGLRGRVTDALAPLISGGEIDALFACGPHGMLGALEDLGRRAHMPCQLSWEAYMRCGLGICGACEHEGLILCLDGPVLVTRP